MSWVALVPPRLGTMDATGMCLRFAQSFFGAPVRYASAWDAWNATETKYSPSDPTPPVPVLLWFAHYGTYGDPPTYANWGHVAVLVPGDAIYTSPTWGYGQGRYGSIAEIEYYFNSKYVGWTPDINGLYVAWFENSPTPEPEPLPIPVPEVKKGLSNMNIYLQATSNSSPITDKSGRTYSRIWAGDRTLEGSKYSSVWERNPDGVTRRLFLAEWKAIQAAFEAADVDLPLTQVHGNVIEQLIYVKRV